LLDALTRRDFDAVQAVFDDDVRFRALVPSGPLELDGAEAAAQKFRSWFGGEDEFEVLDASIGEVGSRLYARWRVGMCPPGRPGESRVAEQHVFTTGTTRIASLDLLCSGFHASVR
jgi:ketosteroid isomerase-like protein